MRYLVVIHKDPNSCYGVSFPDFPGCIGAGDSVEDALQDAALALQAHTAGMIEDGEILPTPRTADEILADPDCADDLTDGRIAYVPLIRDLGTAKRVNISLDPGLLAAIDEEAARRKQTRSAFLATAARKEIGG